MAAQTIFISGGLGTGKVREIKKLVANKRRVLVITQRTNTITKALGPGFKGQSGVRAVVEFAQLHQMMGSRPYDCVVIDQVERILSDVTADGNFSRRNRAVFEAIVKTAKSVIVSDIAISPRTAECFQALTDREPVKIERGLAKTKRSISLFEDLDDWKKQLVDDLAAGKRLWVCLPSRQTFERLLRPLLAGKHLVCVHNEGREFAYATDPLYKDFQGFVIMAEEVVKDDFRVPEYIDRIYTYGFYNEVQTCPPRKMLQMCNICRFSHDPTVYAYVHGAEDCCSPDLLTQKEEEFCDISWKVEDDKFNFKLAPTWISTVHKANNQEKMAAQIGFHAELPKLAEEMGYAVITVQQTINPPS
jgi:hypothetical protein